MNEVTELLYLNVMYLLSFFYFYFVCFSLGITLWRGKLGSANQADSHVTRAYGAWT
jgi:hypothetical protein